MIKRILYSVVLLGIGIWSCNSDDNASVVSYTCDFPEFSYIKGEKNYVSSFSGNYLLVGIDTTYNENQVINYLSSLEYLDASNPYFFSPEYENLGYVTIKFKTTKTCEEVTQIITDLERSEVVSFAHYTMDPKGSCDTLAWDSEVGECVLSYNNTFNVIVLDEEDLDDLYRTVEETNTEIVNQMPWNRKIFVVKATKFSLGDAWQLANYFYETELFYVSEPNFNSFYVN